MTKQAKSETPRAPRVRKPKAEAAVKPTVAGAVEYLPLAQVRPNPDQPRKLFERKALEELAASIHRNGLMQPITVRPVEGGYEIVAGERRYRAHCILAERGQSAADQPEGTIKAHVRVMDERTRDLEAIIENLERVDVTPMEEARAFQRVIASGLSEDELAQRLGKQTWRVRDRLRLLNLAPQFQKMFESGQLSAEAAYEISRLEREADQTKIVQMIGRGQLKGYNAVRAAVMAILDGLSQSDIFGGESEGEPSAPRVTTEEVETVNAMEAKVNRVADMIAAGWKDGECQIARKVSPDRARLMAEKLKAMRGHLLQMENDLRRAAAQGELLAA